MRYNKHTHATTGMPYLLKDCLNNAYNKLHYPEWEKIASRRATPSVSIVHNYINAFTNKPDPTPCTVIYSLGEVAVFRHAQDIV